MERDFKGIWIPKEIWLSTDLTLQEKVFLVEISSLDNEQGCFAGNSYFSEFFGVSKTRVSIIINSLVKKGYITSKIIYKEGSKQILKRVLKECYRGYTRKVKDPMQEKFIENNILNNTVNKDNQGGNEITSKKSTKANTAKQEIIEFINNLEVSNKLKESLLAFEEYRRIDKKKPWTVRSLNITLKKLKDKSKYINEKHLILSIENSIENTWQGIIPARIDKYSNNKSTDINLTDVV